MLNFLKSFIRRDATFTINQQGILERLFSDGSGFRASSGERVNRETVLGLPAFKAGVQQISETSARCDLDLLRRGMNGSREKQYRHKVQKLITRRPNPLQTPFAFFKTIYTDGIVCGNGYAWIEKLGGLPEALWILDPDNVEPLIDWRRAVPSLVYRVTPKNGGTPFVLDASEIIHLRGFGSETNGLVGYRFVDILKDNLGLGLAVQKTVGSYYANGGTIGHSVWEFPGKLPTPEELKQLRADRDSVHSGAGNAFRDVFVPFGGKLNRNPITAEEGQFLQSRAVTAKEIAVALRIPPYLLGESIGTSYGSLQAEKDGMLSDCYEPWLCNMEQELTLKLLTTKEFDSGDLYIEYDRSKLQVIPPDVQANIDVLLVNNGLMSEEQYFEKHNLPTVKDPKHTYRLPANIIIQGEEPPAPPTLPGLPAPPDEEAPTEEGDPQAEVEREAPTEDRMKALLRSSVRTLIERLQKNDAKTKADLKSRHREVFARALPGCGDLIEAWLDDLGDEIESVLPEQRQDIYERLSVEAWTEAAWESLK